MRIRKAAAIGIYGLWFGAIIESHQFEPKLRRVPLTGAAFLAICGTLAWAGKQLTEE